MTDLIEPITQSSPFPFRLLALPVVALFLLRGVQHLLRGDRPRWSSLLAVGIWLLAGVAILEPTVTTRVANLLGIGRGADLLVYLVAITFIASFFYFYQKCRRLESDLTRLVRRLAIDDAERELPGDAGDRRGTS